MMWPLRSSPITGLSSLLRATPPLCPASVLWPLGVLIPLGLLPLHPGDRFPRSARKPGQGSRRLYAGRRPGGKRVIPRTYPGAFKRAPVL